MICVNVIFRVLLVSTLPDDSLFREFDRCSRAFMMSNWTYMLRLFLKFAFLSFSLTVMLGDNSATKVRFSLCWKPPISAQPASESGSPRRV
jgi:hypothetical protein